MMKIINSINFTTIIIFLLAGHCCILYSQELSPFSYNEKIGYVNEKLDVIIAPQYASGGNFSNSGYAIVKKGTYNSIIINKQGEELCNLNSPLLFFLTKDAFAYSTNQGYKIIRVQSGEIIAEDIGTIGYASEDIISIRYRSDRFWSFINLNGEKLFSDTKFIKAYEFQSGVAVVIAESGYSGIINKNGDFIAPPNFLRLGEHFSEGLCPAQAIDNSTGYIKQDGSFAFKVPIVVANNISSTGTDFNDGIAIIQTSKSPSTWQVINTKGEFISAPLFVDWSTDFSNGISVVTKRINNDIFYGFITTDGNYLVEPSFEQASSFISNYAMIVQNGREGLLDLEGDIHWSDEIMY